LTKRKTKAEIRDEARAAWLAENADDLTPRLGERTVNQLADQHAQAVADRARPTLSQRAERRKRDELEARARERYEAWRERAAAGEPPEPPAIGARLVPPRNVIQDGDTFTPLAIIDGKQHKLGSVPSEATARRIADVARHALAIVYEKRQDNPVFGGELAASACIVANYALGFGRSRGRPNKSAGRAAGQATKVHPITSSEVLDRVSDLVGKPAPKLAEPDQTNARPMISDDALGHLTEMVSERLWTLPELDEPQPSPPTAAPNPRDVAEETAAAKIKGWFRLQRGLYRASDLLTAEAEKMLRRLAGEHYRAVTGQRLAPETLDEWAAEQDARPAEPNPIAELLPRRPPWFHPQFYDSKALANLIFEPKRLGNSSR
jgi:hypothetical protein